MECLIIAVMVPRYQELPASKDPTLYFLGTNTRLRSENARLLLEIAQLSDESETARRAADQNAEDLARLRKSEKELIRLRGEVAGLRAEKAQIRLANAYPQPASQSSRNPEESRLADLGTDSPENSSTSLLWAITTMQKDRFVQLVKLPDWLSPAYAEKMHDHLYRQFTNVYCGWQFSSVAKTELQDDGAINLSFNYRDELGREHPLGMKLRKYDDGWKTVIDDIPPESAAKPEKAL